MRNNRGQFTEALHELHGQIAELEAENKIKDGSCAQLGRLVKELQEEKEQLKAENAELKESIYYCSGSCKALTQSIGIDDE